MIGSKNQKEKRKKKKHKAFISVKMSEEKLSMIMLQLPSYEYVLSDSFFLKEFFNSRVKHQLGLSDIFDYMHEMSRHISILKCS